MFIRRCLWKRKGELWKDVTKNLDSQDSQDSQDSKTKNSLELAKITMVVDRGLPIEL